MVKIKEDDALIYYKEGIAIQKTVDYNDRYFDEYEAREHTEIGERLNAFRTKVLLKYCRKSFLDFGIGNGAFIKSVLNECTRSGIVRMPYGYDVCPKSITWLKDRNMYKNPYSESVKGIDTFTFFDSFEHIAKNYQILNAIPHNATVIMSIPIVKKIRKAKKSKHYKLNEHLWYFTESGLVWYMEWYGFALLEILNDETKIGRKDIKTFVFSKAVIK